MLKGFFSLYLEISKKTHGVCFVRAHASILILVLEFTLAFSMSVCVLGI